MKRYEVFDPRHGEALFSFQGNEQTADAIIASLSPGAGLDYAEPGDGWVDGSCPISHQSSTMDHRTS